MHSKIFLNHYHLQEVSADFLHLLSKSHPYNHYNVNDVLPFLDLTAEN